MVLTRRPTPKLLLALLLLLAASCSTAPPSVAPPAAGRPPAAVADSDFESRALLLLLEDRRLYEPAALESMLRGSAPVRRALAVALGRIGDPRGRSLLQGLLVDADLETRRAAAFALGELGAPEAKAALVAAAADPDRELGALAVEALGKLGAPLAEVTKSLGALAPEDRRSRLAPFLFRFKEPAMVDAAREALVSSDPAVRRGAAYGLAREPRPEGAATLRQLLADGDAQIRAWAARGLGEVGELADLTRLEPLLADAADSPRIQALRAGAKLLGRAEALPPLAWGDKLAGLALDPRPGVRAAALEAAGAFLPQRELEAALRHAFAQGEPRERELALAALAVGDAGSLDALLAEAATSPQRDLRAQAPAVAAKLGDRDTLGRLAGDREPAVRVAALSALAGLGDTDRLVAALADPDPAVRAAALDALAESPALPSSRVAALIDAARADGAQNDVRTTGIAVLAKRAAASAAERPAVIQALLRLASDSDWLIRRAVGAALTELGEPRPELGPIDTRRDLEAYRTILRQLAAPVRVAIDTERGTLTLELAPLEAPLTTLSFLQLARQHFFDGQRFHRVVPDFVVQGGDPRGDGFGGPGYALRDEINRRRYVAGAVGMALSGPDTGGSQFFVTLSPQPHLDGGYTVFGRLTSGVDLLERIRQGDHLLRIRELTAAGTAPLR
jgi:cyclophilin family peptidyl-prolyl cis-trans isomerase